MNCPICGQPLSEDDRLIHKWYEPRKWYVTQHLKRTDDPTKDTVSFFDNHYYYFCTQADVVKVEVRTK